MSAGIAFLVEGDADQRFLEGIVLPKLDVENINIFCYSQEPDERVNDMISAFNGMHRDPCFLRDFDYGKQDKESVSGRKNFVRRKYPDISQENIIVVMDAIEGWYLAGIPDGVADYFEISVPECTEHVGKHEFESKLNSSRYSSVVNFQQEIINNYSTSLAIQRNSSFEYFVDYLDLSVS